MEAEGSNSKRLSRTLVSKMASSYFLNSLVKSFERKLKELENAHKRSEARAGKQQVLAMAQLMSHALQPKLMSGPKSRRQGGGGG